MLLSLCHNHGLLVAASICKQWDTQFQLWKESSNQSLALHQQKHPTLHKTLCSILMPYIISVVCILAYVCLSLVEWPTKTLLKQFS